MAQSSATHILCSNELWQWLHEMHISLAFTTYQSNRLFMLGCKPEGRLAINERLFDKPMGLYADHNRLIMSTRYQIWELENRLAAHETYLGCDKLYVPSLSYTTGDLNVHDVVVDKNQELLFINTDFSCLARLCSGFSFEPIWQPPFITQLKAEDRCHLNGLAMRGGEPTYATACGATNAPAGWRNQRLNGGIVMHIPSNEIIATGLSMPHSPRWYLGKLWLLNSGSGELGFLDGEQFKPITFCPGFTRGLAFVGNYAIVGLSKIRTKNFSGLRLEQRLTEMGLQSQCGLMVIDLTTGTILHSLLLDGTVEELFDVVVFPNVRLPKALGFQDDDIDRLINFPDSGGMIISKPTLHRPSIGKLAQIAGLPRNPQIDNPLGNSVKFQQVFHLTPDNIIPYRAMTYPNLDYRWHKQPQRGELLAVSASIKGEMIGLAIAEKFAENSKECAELISLFVLPEYRQLGIATQMLKHLQHLLALPLAMPVSQTI